MTPTEGAVVSAVACALTEAKEERVTEAPEADLPDAQPNTESN